MRQATENGKIFDPNVNAFIDKPDDFGFMDTVGAFREEGASLVEIAARQRAVDNEYDPEFRFDDRVMKTYFDDTPEEFPWFTDRRLEDL